MSVSVNIYVFMQQLNINVDIGMDTGTDNGNKNGHGNGNGRFMGADMGTGHHMDIDTDIFHTGYGPASLLGQFDIGIDINETFSPT
jgi:hypothetical protein